MYQQPFEGGGGGGQQMDPQQYQQYLLQCQQYYAQYQQQYQQQPVQQPYGGQQQQQYAQPQALAPPTQQQQHPPNQQYQQHPTNQQYQQNYSGNSSSEQQQNKSSLSHQQQNQPAQQQQQRVASKASSTMKNDFGEMGVAAQKFMNSGPMKGNKNLSNPTEKVDRPPDNHPYRSSHGISAWDEYGGVIPEPYETFEVFKGLLPVQLNAFYKAGFTAPTPIQAQTWPIAMQQRDVVSIAKTGSGKTLAFLLPAYIKISERKSQGCINALVLAPTRELATQIQEEAGKFGRIAGFYSSCAYGGAPRGKQIQEINAGISVLVATPGRLNDFIESNAVDLSSVTYLVLDEADRMLDMGFEPQIRAIIKHLPRKRQTLMFSATWPEEVRRLAYDFLYQPIHIRLGDQHGGLKANENIQQHLILLRSGEDKDRELISLIKSRFSRNNDLLLIFVARKNTCDFLANALNRVGLPAEAMHGDREQNKREQTLNAFRSGAKPILVATDVASRGIDVKGISAVINYDLPNNTEDYVHRIGRTGRANAAGESFTLVTHSHEDVYKTMGIAEVMERTGQYPPPEVQKLIDDLKRRSEANKERRAAENEQYSKVLIVAEKPSVAKMIAEHLSGGRFRTRRGKSKANQIFEFIKFFAPANERCKLMVTSVVGHIYGLGFTRGYRDIVQMFDAVCEKQITDSTKKLNIIDHLQELGAESDYLYLWLDCDREGENIGFEVISLVQQWVHYDNVYRARFSALTKTELVVAYDNPVRPDRYAAMCVDARQELDLKIGVAFSRLMTRRFLDASKHKFRLKDQKVVSYGPCQTPTLWFCVQRHKEIQKFRSQPYYAVSINVNLPNRQNIELKWSNDTVSDPSQLQQMQEQVQGLQSVRIVSVNSVQKRVNKPMGLNTVQLLKSCSKGIGMSPSNAMHVAETLYTQGYISYPRTETSKYPPSFDLISVLQQHTNHPYWGGDAKYILNKGEIKPSDRGIDVGDHPPITPMYCAVRQDLKPQEWRLYEQVTRSFIASLHDDMEYWERTMTVDANGYQFNYVWHEVINEGFMQVTPWRLNSLKLNKQQNLFFLREGVDLNVNGFNKEELFTKPPDYLEESELISLMDKHGIGTDASISQHVKNIQDRHYVDVCGPTGPDGQKGQLCAPKYNFGKNQRGKSQQPRPASRHMVPRGFGLAFLSSFEELDSELCEPGIRSYMEKQVSKIATGETEKDEVVSSNLKLFREKFVWYQDNIERVARFFEPKQNYDGGDQQNFQNNRGGGFQNNRGGGQNNRGGGQNRGGGFNNNNDGGNRGGFNKNRGGGGFNNRGAGRGGNNQGSRGSFNNRNNDANNFKGSCFTENRGRGRGGGFNNRGGGFSNADSGRNNSDRGAFNNGRGGGFRGGRGQNRGVYNHSDNQQGGFNQQNGNVSQNNSPRGRNNGPMGQGRGGHMAGQKRGNPTVPPPHSTKKVHHSY